MVDLKSVLDLCVDSKVEIVISEGEEISGNAGIMTESLAEKVLARRVIEIIPMNCTICVFLQEAGYAEM